MSTGRSWHAIDAAAVCGELGTDSVRGLSEQEARRRLAEHGPNVLATVGRTPWYAVLLRQFTDALILILLVAAGVALLIGEVTDAVAILAILVLNGLLGFVQEWKAENAIEALRQMLAPKCRVVRDGEEREIETRGLVPGDIVPLEIGRRVPADIRLVEALNLKADESALTGESGSVAKSIDSVSEDLPLTERASIAWMGTAIANGRARGIVVATGMRTEFGRIAELTQTVGTETTPLQRQLGRLGKQLGVIAIVVSALIAAAGWIAGKPIAEMVLTGISLAVAVVPEGLPAVVTVTMALGIRAMVKRRALLRRLPAAETLGAATVVCTDKTGTLTQNEMTVTRIWLSGGSVQLTGLGYDPAGHFESAGTKLDFSTRPDLLELLRTSLVCNNARISKDETGWRAWGEPTEASLVVAAYKAWLHPDGANKVSEFSFNSSRKRMTVITDDDNGAVAHVKGAPEVLLERSTRIRDGAVERALTDEDRRAVDEAYTAMAESGLRTLAVARREIQDGTSMTEADVEQGLTLLGIVGIIDPPRAEVRDAIELATSAGIKVVMITGDAAPTALAIARRVGLSSTRAVTGRDLKAMDDDELLKALRDDMVFARTTPENKLRIVTLLQRLGHIVAMTGDGVNDAPALKKADVGISMGLRGTDVAKSASDVVLTDDNFASIVSAVEEGRRQYDNIQKFVRYLLSSNFGEVAAISLNILLGGPLILLPVQILWMNLVTDGMTALALGMEPAEGGIMRRPPRRPAEPILGRRAVLAVFALGTYMGVATLLVFRHYLEMGAATAQTMAFTTLIVCEKMNVFNFRSLTQPLAAIGFLTNPWVLVAWVSTIGLHVAAVYVPFLQRMLHTSAIEWHDWAVIVAVAAPIFVFAEIFKWVHTARAGHLDREV